MAAQTKTATASTHGASLIRGTHKMRIRGCGWRKHIKSSGFETDGHLWAVSCVFDDRRLSSVSLELLRTDATTDVLAMATLRIECPGGGIRWPETAEWRSDDAHVFPAWPSPSASAMPTCRSWELSIPNEFRWNSQLFMDEHGRFDVYCAVDVLLEDSGRRQDLISVVPPPTIYADLGRLLVHQREWEPETELESWRRRCMPDVTFIVEHTKIQAHRLVLALRSPVFAAEFRWHTAERTLHVHDISASTFRAMLQFIYTDELPLLLPSDMPDRVLDLIVAADRYDIQTLRLMCDNILSEKLQAESVIPTLMVVHGRQRCKQLEAFCIHYMASDPDVYAAVKATEDYKKLRKSYFDFILEITDQVAKRSMANSMGPDSPSSSTIIHQQQMNPSTHCPSELVQGTHEFKIPHFILVQRRHGLGKGICSDTFKVGGFEWKVKVLLYPSPSSEKAEEHLSIYVELLTDPGTDGVQATVCFKLDSPDGWSPKIKSLQKTFTSNSDWGYAKFITMKDVKSRYIADDGSVTIHCDLSITKGVYTSTGTTTQCARTTMLPSNNIISHLEQLLEGEQASDMRFLVEESELRAHSLVIAARSQVLYEAVAAVANKDDDHIVLVNDVTVAVFKAMLHFIYTDKLPPMEDLAPGVDENEVTIAQDLLVAACYFRLDRMKAMCENLLARLAVSEENALSTLELAQDLHCSELKDYCNAFIQFTKKSRGRDYWLLNWVDVY